MSAALKPLFWIVVGGMLGGLLVSFVPSNLWKRVDPVTATPAEPTQIRSPASAGPTRIQIRSLGSIQPRQGIVDVAIPVGLKLVQLGPKVQEGSLVNEKDLLAILDGYDERCRELDVLEAEITKAREALAIEDEEEKRALAEIEHERARAIRLGELEQNSLFYKILSLDAKYRFSKQQLDQVEGLQSNGTVALQQYEQIRAQSEIALDELNYAKAEKAHVEKALSLNTSDEKVAEQRKRIQAGARRARAQNPLETLERKKKLIEVQRERCRVVAPRDGQILKIMTQIGEAAVSKPLLQLGDTSRMYVLAEIYEENRHYVKVGDKAKIEGRGLPLKSGEELSGRIQSISPIITPHAQSPIDPTARENARVFEAWIELNLDESKDKELLEKLRGLCLLPVDITITVDG